MKRMPKDISTFHVALRDKVPYDVIFDLASGD
jgi:hypothetical protein